MDLQGKNHIDCPEKGLADVVFALELNCHENSETRRKYNVSDENNQLVIMLMQKITPPK